MAAPPEPLGPGPGYQRDCDRFFRGTHLRSVVTESLSLSNVSVYLLTAAYDSDHAPHGGAEREARQQRARVTSRA